MLKRAAALLGTLCIIWSIPAPGQSYPLPPWYFYGHGTVGTYDGSSTSPDNASLSVTVNPPPPPPPPGSYELAGAGSSAGILVIAPRTTYTLTLAARISGWGTGNAFVANDTATIAGISIQGSSWKNYTNSFTTGGTADPSVGQNLYVYLALTGLGSMPGTSSASFTNVQLNVTAQRPPLTIRGAAPGQVQLRWPTNFIGCVAESATNLLADAWESLTNVPTVQSNQYIVPLSLQPGQRFFRLRQD
jgi:hypothetical protein